MGVGDEEEFGLPARLVEPAELGKACCQETAGARPIGLVPAQCLDGGSYQLAGNGFSRRALAMCSRPFPTLSGRIRSHPISEGILLGIVADVDEGQH